MRKLVASVGFILTLAVPGQATEIIWTDLIDAEAQVFEDPYLALSPDQLSDLVAVAKLRPVSTSADAQELASREAALRDAGIDVDWLIEQRWVVAERRERAASSGNAALDGAEVTISGFAIPAPPEADGTPAAYLVERRGLCSHMPPPMPNQMVRVRLGSDWRPDYVHQPVRLTGRLTLKPSEQVFIIVDGPVAMKASWQMDAELAEDWVPLAAMSASSEWVETLRVKMQASRATARE